MSTTAEIERVPDEADAKPARKGGRPTRAAAAERDERMLEIATQMFMDHGFEATSIDALAEAASIGKATLYARYADKTALFADVLRRRILQVYAPFEEQFGNLPADADLATTLRQLADGLIANSLTESAIALGRILAAQGQRFPELADLAMTEGFERQVRLIAGILSRFDDGRRYRIGDASVAADLFLAMVYGRASRFKIYGLPIDRDDLARRTKAAVDLFMRAITV